MKTTILIVDDDPTVRESYAYFLEDCGFETRQAHSREHALQVLEQSPCQVALLDMKMEGESDGLLLNQDIREQYPDVETVIITAFAGYNTAVQALKDGAVDYLSKAASNDEILQAIQTALARRASRASQQAEQPEPEVILGLVCGHSFHKEGLLHFTSHNPTYALQLHSRHLHELTINRDVEPVDILLICAECNFKNIEDAKSGVQRVQLMMPDAIPVLTNHSFDIQERALLLEAGVKGILPDDLDEEGLLLALTRLQQGEIWAGRHELSLALKQARERSHNDPQTPVDKSVDTLTPRERDVLRLLSLDFPNKDIALKLGISDRTIKTHLYNIYQKLGVHTRSEAVQEAYRLRVLP